MRRADRIGHGRQAKRMAWLRDKKCYRVSRAVSLKAAMKRKRERKRDRERKQARKLKNTAYSWGYPSQRECMIAVAKAICSQWY